MSTVALRVRVHGVVQGVFFRDGCATEARRLGVTGWVRNEDDGTVMVHVEGEPHAVGAVLDWCRSGPPRAEVDRVEQEDAEAQGFTDFEVW